MTLPARLARVLAAGALAAALVAVPTAASTAAAARPFPDTVRLPADFSPDPVTGVAARLEQTGGRPLTVGEGLERPTTALYRAGSLWVANGTSSSSPTTDQASARARTR